MIISYLESYLAKLLPCEVAIDLKFMSLYHVENGEYMKIQIFIVLLLISFSAIAKKNYITGTQKVTFRSGPSTSNKVIKMVESEEAVELLSRGEEWSKVRVSSGEEGYVLNRFLTASVPYSLRFSWLKSEYEKLKEANEELKTKNTELLTEQKRLNGVETEFEELKKGSANYLDLKKKFAESQKETKSQSELIDSLKSKVNMVYVYWFLAGAGVFLIGWIIGSIGRKKKGYGGSIKL